jgi:DNA-binding transcriptional LysR family regulator
MNFRNLDLNLLRVFDEVMTERSLTRAADNLAMTQPAVSNAMRRLRDALGDDVVKRAGYGVEPTPRALALWPVVREALSSLQNSIAPDAFDPVTSTQTFTLTMADASAALLMPALVNVLEAMRANVGVRVVPLPTRDPRKILEAGDADLAVGHFPVAITAIRHHKLNSDAPNPFFEHHMYSTDYVCVMRRGHPLAKRAEQTGLTLDEYCAATHLRVSFSGRPVGIIDEALAALNRTRRVVLTVNQFFTAGRVVTGSDLLAVLPRHFLPSTGMEKELAVFEMPMDLAPIQIDLVWHRRNNAGAAQKWFREMVVHAAAKKADELGVKI